MSTRTVAVCDLCGAELTLKTSGPLNEGDYAREIAMEGWHAADTWTHRGDPVHDICPNHPRPA